MTNITFLIALIACVLALDHGESHAAPSVKPDKLVLGYVNHPIMKSRMIPLMKEVYRDLDIKTVFIEMPSHREMLLLSEGKIDGVVAGSEALFSQYKGVIKVQPPLTYSQFVLYCHPSVPCSAEVLSEKSHTVLMTQASERAVLAKFGQINASIYELNALNAIPVMVSSGKFLYGVYVQEKDAEFEGLPDGINSYVLFDTAAYHILHKRHLALSQKVTPILERHLNEL